jgi:hypothetical protein
LILEIKTRRVVHSGNSTLQLMDVMVRQCNNARARKVKKFEVIAVALARRKRLLPTIFDSTSRPAVSLMDVM